VKGQGNNSEVLFLAVDELLQGEQHSEAHIVLAGSQSLGTILADRVMSLRLLLRSRKTHEARVLLSRLVQVAGAGDTPAT
jgi:hypothetical protein